MARGVKARGMAALLALIVLAAPVSASADFAGVDPTSKGRVVYRILRPSHWLVGVTVDRAAGFARLDDQSLVSDQYLGLSATYRRAWFGGNVRYMMTPQRLAPRTRAMLALGARVVTSSFGRSWSWGVAVHGEANLVDHHWMLLLCPVEIGTDLVTTGTMNVQLFVGLRYAAKGSMIHNFFIDPNGHESALLEQVLQDRLDTPWEGFVSLVFARRLD